MATGTFRRCGGEAGVAVHTGIFGRDRVHGLRQGNILALGIAAGRVAGNARLLDAGMVAIHTVQRPFVQAVVKGHGGHGRGPLGALGVYGRKRHLRRRHLVAEHHARGPVHGHDGGACLKAGQCLKTRLVVTGGAIQANAFGGVGEAGYGFFHGASEPSQWPKSHDNQWHEDQSQSEREEDLFTLLSFHDDIMSNVNPATGLPMIGGVDTAGNPFGFDLHENSMASISFDE